MIGSFHPTLHFLSLCVKGFLSYEFVKTDHFFIFHLDISLYTSAAVLLPNSFSLISR